MSLVREKNFDIFAEFYFENVHEQIYQFPVYKGREALEFWCLNNMGKPYHDKNHHQ